MKKRYLLQRKKERPPSYNGLGAGRGRSKKEGRKSKDKHPVCIFLIGGATRAWPFDLLWPSSKTWQDRDE